MPYNDDLPKINTFTPETAKRASDRELTFAEMYPHEVAAMFGSDISAGLDVKKIKKQRARYGDNDISEHVPLSFAESLKRQYTNLLTVFLLFSALVLYIFERDAVLLLVPCGMAALSVVNALLEDRAGKTVEKLRTKTSPGATVIRGGKVAVTDSRSVVCGDVIFIEDGGIVPADARIIECNGLTVLETPVSGISAAAKKDARFVQKNRDARVSENMVYAGSIVTGGSGVAIVCATGKNVQISRLPGKKETPLFPATLGRVLKSGRQMTVFAALCELAVIFIAAVRGASLIQAFILALSVGVTALSDTAFAFSAAAFAGGLERSLEKGAAIRNTDSLTKLMRVDSVMCDKQTAFPPKSVAIDRMYDCFSEYRVLENRSENAYEVLRYLILCSTVKEKLMSDRDRRRSNVQSRYEGSALAVALMEAAEKMGVGADEIHKDFYRIESEFDSRGETVRVLGLLGGNPVVILKGTPENVISRCAGYRQNGTNMRFDDKSRRRALAFAEEISKTRMPVAVAVGYTAADSLRDITAERKLVLMGFAGLYSSFELNAASAVYKCRQAGIEIVVSSDDSFYTAYNTSKNAGIIESDSEICTAETLRTAEEGLFIANSGTYKVFLGLRDEEWLYIEQLRRQNGKTVAVSASRTEQLSLMKEADVSFVPRRGSTDTLLNSCDVQMENDGFDTVTETLKAARLTVKRIMNTSEYFVVGFMTLVFWTVLSSAAFGTLAFSAAGVFLYGITVNTLLSVSLAFVPMSRNILREPLPDTKPKATVAAFMLPLLYSAVGAALCIVSARITLPTSPQAPASASMITFTMLLFFYSLMCGSKHSVLTNRSYMNYLSFAMLGISAGVSALCMYVPRIAEFMGFAPLNGTQVLVAAGIPFILFLIVQVMMMLTEGHQNK